MQKLKIAAMGVEHRHIFGQLEGMLNLDCEFVGWWTENDNRISNNHIGNRGFLCYSINFWNGGFSVWHANPVVNGS